ncbi:MAG: Protein TonB [Bacteroidota bacterium]|nr:Protein TonB [Bacteroidota bacterium]
MIKAAFYLAAFYMVFSFFLSRDTFYKRNRIFILFSVLSSLMLPLITIRTNNPVNLPLFGKTLSEVLINGTLTGPQPEVKGAILSSGPQIIMTIYLIGVLISGGRFIADLSELVLLISGKKSTDGNIIRFNGLNTGGFSALGFVFINSKLKAEDANEIIKHEQNHLDHYHSFDIIFIETIKVFQWFNPFIYMINRSLRAVHEFQADEGCLIKGVAVVSYQQLLMNQLFRSKAFSITNSFSNPTLIKKRMIMMSKERSGTLANLKLLLVVPVIAIVMIAFSSCGGKTKPTEGNVKEIAPTPDPSNLPAYSDRKVIAGEAIPPDAPPPPPPPPPYTVKGSDTAWYKVDVMPVFPGGDAALLRYIAENTTYPDAAKEKNIQGKVLVSFIVNENCKVSDVSITSSVNTEIDAEALRVVNSLPSFEKPGLKDGKTVPVWFSVPITFSLK